MILEAFQFAATQAVTPAEFRPFVRSSVNLWSRANRCASAWRPHEEMCKSHISETITDMRQRRTAVVLGSGLLRDVPILGLARAFDTVVLVDLVHLASVRCWIRARRLANLRLISRDLSGLSDVLAGGVAEPLSFLRQVPYVDLVVSANILSQIGVGARRQIDRSGNADATVATLVKAHLEGLSALPCRTVLLTDISYQVTDRGGAVLEEADLLCGVPAPAAKARWDWAVAPYGELGRDRQAIHRVIAA